MNFTLLLADPHDAAQASRAAGLQLQVLQTSPGGEDVTVTFLPNRADDLHASAKSAAQLAYRILFREGIVRSQLVVRFQSSEVPQNVVGRSADLLFALAIILQVYQESAQGRVGASSMSCVAATGVLESDGTVRAVDGLASKLQAACSAFGATPVIIFFPAENGAAVDVSTFSQQHPNLRFQAIGHLDEALEQLGIVRERVYLRNPFRGLEYFDYEHRAIFFGRDAEIRELVQQLLRREANGVPGVLVEGASGSGKSSFLRAGVLPALVNPHLQPEDVKERMRARPVRETVRRAIWRGVHLLDGSDESRIVRSIRDCWRNLPELGGHLTGDYKTLEDLAAERRKYWPLTQRFVWLIDQFEELFRLGLDDSTFDALGQFLCSLQTEGAWTLASIRADAVAQLKRHHALRAPFGSSEGYYYLETLTGTALDDVIERPARAADLTFGLAASGARLDIAIREELYRTRENALPLLQFTLNELYSKRFGGELAYEVYEKLGGLTGSVATRADALLPPNDNPTVIARLFRGLVTVDEGGRASRRLADLMEFPKGSPERLVLDRFVEARLCVTDERDQKPVVVFAHESLLTSWPALVAWLEQEQHLLQLRAIIERDAHLWIEHRESDDWLATAPDKLAAHGRLLSAGVVLDANVLRFSQRSSARARHQRFLKRAAVAAIAAMAVAATGFALVALRSERRAGVEARTAQETSNFLINIFKVADPAASRGKSILAREVLDKGAERARTQFHTDPAVQSRLMRSMGIVYTSLGLYSEAESLLQDALRLASSSTADRADIAQIKVSLGEVLVDREKFKEAENLYKEAIAVFDKLDRREDATIARGDLGFLYWAMTDYRNAQPLLEEALKRSEATFGNESEEVAGALQNLGLNVRDMGDPGKALPLLERSNEIRKKLFGENYYWYGVGLETVGFTQIRLGQYAQARETLRSSVAALERTLGAQHPLVAEPLQTLGQAEVDVGDNDDAVRDLNRALSIEEASGDPEGGQVSRTLFYLARAHAAQSDFQQAFQLYRRSADLAKRAYGPTSQDYLNDLIFMAMDQRRAGLIDDSVATLRSDLAVIEQAQVSGMPKMGVLAALADSLCYRTVSPEGYNFANEALALNAAASGSLPVFITESDIAYCDPDAAHTEQNAAILQRAVIAITKERGENAPQTKDVKRRLARFQQFWRQTKSTPSS
jgi:tetratricopeptide (TPR) repeat protein